MTAFAAIDLGASSGRVMLAEVGPSGVTLNEVHRFVNRPVKLGQTLHWDVLSLWAGVVDGLRAATARTERLDGIGIDSWAIDYGLLDEDGRLLGNPVHYRDARTDGVSDRFSTAELYARTGIQVLPFNTIFQLTAAAQDWQLQRAARALLIPDLFGFWLTGQQACELTNASTTGLLNAQTRQWDADLFDQIGVSQLFPAVSEPGTLLGSVLPSAVPDLAGTSVSLVGSHDTASAVAGVPAVDQDFAYISCGTWSLVGVEADQPVLTEEARQANFSNELGLDGTVRFLKNVMGLWLLQESIRTWQRDGVSVELTRLLAQAAELPAGRWIVDPDRPEFLPPGDMPSRIKDECRRTAQPEPQTPAEITRCILDSLATAYRRVIRQAAELSGVKVRAVHLVGGGAQNALLCQLAANACELPVIAGPVEAAAYGNVLVQARSAGLLSGSLTELRTLLPTESIRAFYPQAA